MSMTMAPAIDSPVLTAAPDAPAVEAGKRLKAARVESNDRTMAIFMHLGPLGGIAFPPLVFVQIVLWLIAKDRSVFADDHGRETVNVLITWLLGSATMFILGWMSFGLMFVPLVAWQIIIVINMIRGAIAAGNNEYFRYPMTLRLLN